MQILIRLFGMKPRLERWEGKAFSAGVENGPGPRDSRDSYERQVAVESPGEPERAGPFRRVADAIWRYAIFPPSYVTPILRRAPVEVGDAVGICYHFFPGIDFFFAARVIARFDGQEGSLWRAGFTYRTLHGHPETGDETFSVEKDLATGVIRIALRSWSRPGLFLTRLGYPFTRRTQRRASHAALDHLQSAASANPNTSPLVTPRKSE
jgi:uncharacterized protein (UPF0548 family)